MSTAGTGNVEQSWKSAKSLFATSGPGNGAPWAT